MHGLAAGRSIVPDGNLPMVCGAIDTSFRPRRLRGYRRQDGREAVGRREPGIGPDERSSADDVRGCCWLWASCAGQDAVGPRIGVLVVGKQRDNRSLRPPLCLAAVRLAFPQVNGDGSPIRVLRRPPGDLAGASVCRWALSCQSSDPQLRQPLDGTQL